MLTFDYNHNWNPNTDRPYLEKLNEDTEEKSGVGYDIKFGITDLFHGMFQLDSE